jgi:hypothetical protein
MTFSTLAKTSGINTVRKLLRYGRSSAVVIEFDRLTAAGSRSSARAHVDRKPTPAEKKTIIRLHAEGVPIYRIAALSGLRAYRCSAVLLADRGESGAVESPNKRSHLRCAGRFEPRRADHRSNLRQVRDLAQNGQANHKTLKVSARAIE